MTTMTTTIDLSIIIPAYNEEQRIRPTLADVDAFLAASGLTYEILVVDDGSTDGTVALVRDVARSLPRVRCIPSRPNRGKGFAVRLGMLSARGAVRVMCDADGSMPASELPKLVNPIRLGGADVAIGSRWCEGAVVARRQPFYRRIWSRLSNLVIRRTLVPGIRDTQCGFKAFTAEAARDVFGRCQIDGWSFDLEALALCHRLGYAVTEVPVTWADDDRSKINPLRDALRGIRELFAIRRNLRVAGRLAGGRC